MLQNLGSWPGSCFIVVTIVNRCFYTIFCALLLLVTADAKGRGNTAVTDVLRRLENGLHPVRKRPKYRKFRGRKRTNKRPLRRLKPRTSSYVRTTWTAFTESPTLKSAQTNLKELKSLNITLSPRQQKTIDRVYFNALAADKFVPHSSGPFGLAKANRIASTMITQANADGVLNPKMLGDILSLVQGQVGNKHTLQLAPAASRIKSKLLPTQPPKQQTAPKQQAKRTNDPLVPALEYVPVDVSTIQPAPPFRPSRFKARKRARLRRIAKKKIMKASKVWVAKAAPAPKAPVVAAPVIQPAVQKRKTKRTPTDTGGTGLMIESASDTDTNPRLE